MRDMLRFSVNYAKITFIIFGPRPNIMNLFWRNLCSGRTSQLLTYCGPKMSALDIATPLACWHYTSSCHHARRERRMRTKTLSSEVKREEDIRRK